jgi:protein tyrosine/serine phosphatase
MNKEKLTALYKKYELTPEDVFKHQHYLIITRSGIEKIQGIEKINIKYEVVKCEPNFSAVKAYNDKLETFGSALKGADYKDGNTNSWYVLEMAEKRAMSRLVLKLTGFYELGVFGEDESEDFKKPKDAK